MWTAVGLTALVCAWVLIAHWPALRAQSTWIDDGDYILKNHLVQHPSWASARCFLSEVFAPSTVPGYYQPLTMISLMLDWAAGGRPEDLHVFHRTNLTLHVANTALIIWLIYQLFGEPWAAALVGLLFGVHPLTVEPVTWLAERKTVLTTFFALCSLVLYVRYTRKDSWGALSLALVMYLLALLSKPTSTPLPLVMLLMDVWPLRRFGRRAMLEKLPFLLIGAGSAVVTFVSQSRTAMMLIPHGESAPRVPLTVCHLVMFYLGKIVWPQNLSAHYVLPDPLTLSNPIVLGEVVGTALLSALLILSLRWTRALLVAAAIGFAAILPTLGVVGYSWLAASDKYVYLPIIGLLVLLGAAATSLWQRQAYRLGTRAALLGAVLLIAAAETRGTREYEAKWADGEGLRRHFLTLAPMDPVMHYEVAWALACRGAFAEAQRELEAIIRKSPDDAKAIHLLGLMLAAQGKLQEGTECFKHLVSTVPQYADARVSLGMALGDAGNLEAAVAEYREALRLRPGLFQARTNLGIALAQLGRYQEAAEILQGALAYAPGDPELHYHFGMTLLNLGQPRAAAAEFGETLRLDPRHLDAQARVAGLRASPGSN